LITGAVHDSNPIKLQANTLYEFSTYVKASASNNSNSILYAYFLSGDDKIKIAEIDNTFNFGVNRKIQIHFLQ